MNWSVSTLCAVAVAAMLTVSGCVYMPFTPCDSNVELAGQKAP